MYKYGKNDPIFESTSRSFKITPYKTCLYILLVEIENKKIANEHHCYYAFCIWNLINQSNMSLPILKCYIYTFMNDFYDILKSFNTALSTYCHKDIAPNNDQLLFNPKCVPNFLKPLSLIGLFVRNYELEYLMLSTDKRFQCMKQWSYYLSASATDDEIETFSRQWDTNIEKTLKLLDVSELNVENKKKEQ